MTLSNDIRTTRAAVERLLNDMGLPAFAYTVEHKEEGWTLRIECGGDEGWHVITLRVEPAELCASLVDRQVREKLWTEWAPRLRACMQGGAGPAAG